MSSTHSQLEGLRALGYRGRAESEVPLATKTTWKIGGPAEWLLTPLSIEDLALALRWSRATGLDHRLLGNGSNLLVADEGVRGVVLHLKRTLDQVEINGSDLQAGAGAAFPTVARRAAKAGLAGLEFASGIPGTVGGAIVMNAGWHTFETGNWVTSVDVLLQDGELKTHDRSACAFRYRGSRFLGGDEIVLAARFRLEQESAALIESRLEGFVASRKANQPTELPSCGSVFVQPPGDFAGRLIDTCGLKGAREGAIEVSPKHANFFVNHGGGSAAEVLRLVERVEREVLNQTGVSLTREFEYWSDTL